jgi:DNA-directed RNA polymerase-3 subunit RPC5
LKPTKDETLGISRAMAMAIGDKFPLLDADVDMANDLASLDAPAATSAAAGGAPSTRFRPKAKGKKPRPKAKPPKPVPVAVPKPEPEPEPEAVPVPEPDANPAPPPEDTMEVDGAVDATGHGEGAEEDFVVREIDVYFNPKPFEDDTRVMQCARGSDLLHLCD